MIAYLVAANQDTAMMSIEHHGEPLCVFSLTGPPVLQECVESSPAASSPRTIAARETALRT